MSDQRDGGIAWTDQTWNCIRGCSRVSPGCVNCYAESVAARFCGPGLAYEGLAFRKLKVMQDGTEHIASRWTGDVRMVPERLADPLRWRRPRRVFVNSMSDLFHEKLTNEQIAAVFGVMAAAPAHTFQVLTKRARRMREWFDWAAKRGDDGLAMFPDDTADWRIRQMLNVAARRAGADVPSNRGGPWPLPGVWLGVSAENQETADERIPELLRCPAAVRWVSAEPLIGPVDFNAIQIPEERDGLRFSALTRQHDDRYGTSDNLLDWIVVGGESGHGARPFNITWLRKIMADCKAAGVPLFIKQLGSRPCETKSSGETARWYTGDPKGGNPITWPEELRVREWPATPEAT